MFIRRTFGANKWLKGGETKSLSNEKNETYTRRTSTMVAVFNSLGEIQELRLKGKTYEGDGCVVYVPESTFT